MRLKIRFPVALGVISICFLSQTVTASHWDKIGKTIKENGILLKNICTKSALKNLRYSNEIIKTTFAGGTKYLLEALNKDYERLKNGCNTSSKYNANYVVKYLEEHNDLKNEELVQGFFKSNDQTALEQDYIATLETFINHINDNSFSEETLKILHHKLIAERSITHQLAEMINRSMENALLIDNSSITAELDKIGYSAENLITTYEKHIEQVQEKTIMLVKIKEEK